MTPIEALEMNAVAVRTYGSVSRTWKQYRRLFFKGMRRMLPVGITVNGSIRRVYSCAVCGSTISMCNRWPATKMVIEFFKVHCSTRHQHEFMAHSRRNALRRMQALHKEAHWASVREMSTGNRTLAEAESLKRDWAAYKDLLVNGRDSHHWFPGADWQEN